MCKIINKLIKLGCLFSAMLAVSGFAVAEKGTGYMFNVSENITTSADGTIINESTSKGVWVVENQPAGFPSVMQGNCSATWVMAADFSNKGSSWRCVTTDTEGDGYLNVGSIMAPDWSDCAASIVSSWGKYAGWQSSANCQPMGPFAGKDTSTYMWNGEWTAPE